MFLEVLGDGNKALTYSNGEMFSCIKPNVWMSNPGMFLCRENQRKFCCVYDNKEILNSSWTLE